MEITTVFASENRNIFPLYLILNTMIFLYKEKSKHLKLRKQVICPRKACMFSFINFREQ